MNQSLSSKAWCLLLLLAVFVLGSLPRLAAGQSSDDIERDIVLVLDNSGSMKVNDPEFAMRQAVMRFIQEFGPHATVSIVVFDQSVLLGQAFLPVNEANLPAFSESLERIDYHGLYTDSPAAIERAIYELKNYARPLAERFIVFVTDGIVDTGSVQADVEKTRWLKQELAADARDNAIKIFSIGFTENADFQLIQSLAQQTAGEYVRALDVSEMDAAFDRIQQEMLAEVDTNATVHIVEQQPDKLPDSDEQADLAVVPQPADDINKTDDTAIVDESATNAEIVDEQVAYQPVDPPAITAEIIRPVKGSLPQTTASYLPELLLGGFLALLSGGLLYLFYLRPKWQQRGDEFYIAKAFLVDVHNYTKEKRYRLSDAPTMIGRMDARENSYLQFITINESTIGRRHALIDYRDYAFWVHDQGSTNGTYVNDMLIDKATRLRDGDRVRFHKFEFVFEVPELQEEGVTELSPTVLKKAAQARARELPEPQFDISMGHEIPETAKQSLSSEFDIIEYADDFRLDSEDETMLPEQLQQDALERAQQDILDITESHTKP